MNAPEKKQMSKALIEAASSVHLTPEDWIASAQERLAMTG
jgi:hypothetical protein